MRDVEAQLDELWGCIVVDLRIDLAGHSITFVLEDRKKEGSTWRSLQLSGVVSFSLTNDEYFNDEYFEDRAYLLEPWSYAELTSAAAKFETHSDRVVWVFRAEIWRSAFVAVATGLSVSGPQSPPTHR